MDNTAHVLVLSGGSFRGALQYWPIRYLWKKYRFKSVHGVSVGSLNGVMASMDKLDELEEMWNSISGIRSFLTFRWVYLICWFFGLVALWEFITKTTITGGVYSMRGLRAKLKAHAKLSDIKVPFAAGAVSLNTGMYHTLSTKDMKRDDQLVAACLASSCMSPLMTPPRFYPNPDDLRGELGLDGGARNIFPVPVDEILQLRARGYRVVVHAIGCTPRQRISPKPDRKVNGLVELALRSIDVMEGEVFDTDILQLRSAVGPEGQVHLWLPAYDTGAAFDASAETIQKRLTEGRRMVARGPVVYDGFLQT